MGSTNFSVPSYRDPLSLSLVAVRALPGDAITGGDGGGAREGGRAILLAVGAYRREQIERKHRYPMLFSFGQRGYYPGAHTREARYRRISPSEKSSS